VKEQIIQLEPHDDIDSVRDRLGYIRVARALLVFPDARHPILRSKVDMRLLQREITRRRAQVALITRDPVVTDNAREVGIPCFTSIEASRRRYWRTAKARLKVPRKAQPTKLDADLVEGGTRLHPENRRLKPEWQRAGAFGVFGLTIILLLAGASIILPGATVRIAPASNQVTATITVTADPEAEAMDTTLGVIPARVVGVEVEGSATVEATGSVLQPSQNARGIVNFTNLVPEQVTIPAGTIVRTSAAEPVRFTTLIDTTLAGKIGETVEVPVEAVEPGFEGNLPSSRINEVEGPLSTRVGVTNPEPTRGGDSIEVRAISEEDYDRVRALLTQQLLQRAYAEMQTGLLIDTEFLPIESLEVVLTHSETYNGYINQPTDTVSLTMRVTVQGVAIDERRAREIVYAELADKVGEGYQISTGSLVFRLGEVISVDAERRVTFIMQGAGDVSTHVDEERVKELIRGARIGEAQVRLERELALTQAADIEVWPGFWPAVPTLPLRIQVEVIGSEP
jgi:hypothetical protein